MGPDVGLRIEVLGPIRAVAADGTDRTPTGALQRRLLALLVLRRDRVVTVDQAVDALWPEAVPQDATAALQNHISRLRRQLPDGVIESTGDGYRLVAAAIRLDADELAARLAADALGADDLRALDEVLARWQGPAYPELDDTDDGRAEASRLDEVRLRARERRAAAHLDVGAHGAAVAELTALVDAEPLRERPRGLLMAALAAAGRHAEALRVYDDFRRRLGDELGIEPSPALAAQHAELLAGSGPAAWRATTRLPSPVASLVGRDDLADQVTATLRDHRLVTLVGPGGMGKTRLALEVGHRVLAERPDRPVVLAELATAGAANAADVVAASLRIDARPHIPLAQRIADVVGTAPIVVVLDNCEHVLDEVAPLAAHLLSSCPEVVVLATSRERLRIPGEHVCLLPALGGEDEGPAVQLFVERARAVAPGFDPDPAKRAAVAEIVRRLDGLPLAIELAAARLHTHDLAEVAAGLDHRFSLLAAGPRTSPRHESLRAAVSWSYALLDEALRRTFDDLAVFVGAFTAADAAAVCDADPVVVTDALTTLTERSLVQRAPGHRYVLLETLRAFGAEQLEAEGRTDEVAARHARHQVDWVEEADRHIDVHVDGIAAIDAALPELRSALDWLLAHDEVELAGRLVTALHHYGLFRQRPDVLAWSERVTAADPHDRSPMASPVWGVAAYAAWLAGDMDGCTERAERACAVAEQHAEPVRSEALMARANVALFAGRLDEAVHWYQEAQASAVDDPAQRLLAHSTEVLARAYADDPSATAMAAAIVADIEPLTTACAAYAWHCAGEAELRGDIAEARRRFERAVDLAERTRATLVAGLSGASKASIEARSGDALVAAADYRRLITRWQAAGVWSTQWTVLRSIAQLLARLERWHHAAVLEGAVRATTAGHRIFGADAELLAELQARLRKELGDEAYEDAARAGARLDGDAAVEHALRSL